MGHSISIDMRAWSKIYTEEFGRITREHELSGRREASPTLVAFNCIDLIDMLLLKVAMDGTLEGLLTCILRWLR